MAYASTLRHVPVYLQTPNTCTTFFAPRRIACARCCLACPWHAALVHAHVHAHVWHIPLFDLFTVYRRS